MQRKEVCGGRGGEGVGVGRWVWVWVWVGVHVGVALQEPGLFAPPPPEHLPLIFTCNMLSKMILPLLVWYTTVFFYRKVWSYYFSDLYLDVLSEN